MLQETSKMVHKVQKQCTIQNQNTHAIGVNPGKLFISLFIANTHFMEKQTMSRKMERTHSHFHSQIQTQPYTHTQTLFPSSAHARTHSIGEKREGDLVGLFLPEKKRK